MQSMENTQSMSEVTVYNLLKDKGYSEEAIAGIMGNIAVETGGTFDYKQKQKNGNGYGLFQFDFMKKHYNDYLKENDIEDSAAAQIDFMHDTIYGNKQDLIGSGTAKYIQEIMQSPYPEDIASGFMNEWERPSVPHESKRQMEAIKYYNFPVVENLDKTGFESTIK